MKWQFLYCGNIRNDCFCANVEKKCIKFKKDYSKTFSKRTGTKIQSQHWGRNIKLSMAGIAVKYISTSINNSIHI